MTSIMLYSAILGDCPDRQAGLPRGEHGCLFVDRTEWSDGGGWKIRNLDEIELPGSLRNKRRRARYIKLHPHLLFPGAEFWFWVDGSHTPRHPLAKYLQYLGDADLCAFQHASRNCLYQEAEACKWLKKGDAAAIARQVREYRKRGVPYNAGLVETPVLLMRNCDRAREFLECWWDEIEKFSERDQISFPAAANECGLSYAHFPGTAWDNKLFHWRNHW